MSVLNSLPMGFYSPHALLQTARRDGVKILPICIQFSIWDHQLEKQEDTSFALRLGFRLVKSSSEQAAKKIVQERRKQGKWQSLEDLIYHTKIYRDELSALAAANAFSCFKLTRSMALWNVAAVPIKPLIENEEKNFPKVGADPPTTRPYLGIALASRSASTFAKASVDE